MNSRLFCFSDEGWPKILLDTLRAGAQHTSTTSTVVARVMFRTLRIRRPFYPTGELWSEATFGQSSS